MLKNKSTNDCGKILSRLSVVPRRGDCYLLGRSFVLNGTKDLGTKDLSTKDLGTSVPGAKGIGYQGPGTRTLVGTEVLRTILVLIIL